MELFGVTKNIVTVNLNKVGSNISCINFEDGLVFVDTGLLVNKLTKFRKDMEKKFNKKTSHLILTHNHQDHIFGMKAFIDVPIIATNLCKERIKERIKTDFTEKGLKKISEQYLENKPFFEYMGIKMNEVDEIAKLEDIEIKIPTIGFDDVYELGSEQNKIEIKISGGHTLDSTTVYVPSEKALFTGDEFYHSIVPLLGGIPENPENWLAALKSWLQKPIDIVIPGHGSPIDFDYVAKAIEFVERTFSILKEMKKKNTDVEEVLKDKRLNDHYGKSTWADNKWWKQNLKGLFEVI